MSSIVILESQGRASDRLREAASIAGIEDVRVAGSVADVERAVRERTARVLVVGSSADQEEALRLAKRLRSGVGTSTVVVSEAADTAVYRSAMRSGAVDVVTDEDTIDEIAQSFCRALDAYAGVSSAGGADGEAGERLGRLITVFSTKGGVGKTVLATNLAVALSRSGEGRVCLIDLDLEFGDVAIMLGIKPEHTIADLMRVFDKLDEELLEGYMATHGSGVKALLAPVRPEDAETISASRVSRILELLQRMFDYVVVDTSPSFSETVLAALDKSDEVYVVTMMDVASIKNTRISVQKLHQLGYDGSSVRIVLNRADSKVLIEPGEVNDAIGGEIVARIPSDRVVPRSVNKGVPIVTDVPRSAVARSMIALAKKISETQREEADDVA